jgi:tetratricopeptide (TPR) repeat protein
MLKSSAGDRLLIGPHPEGLGIFVIPANPPFDASVVDVFQLGLKFTNAARFLAAMEGSGEYRTDDGDVIVRRDIQGMTLAFRAAHDHRKWFETKLARGPAGELIRIFKAELSGDIYSGHGAGAAVKPAAPARNAACPCGSGRKHKKCCGVRSDSGCTASLQFASRSKDPEVIEALRYARANPGVVEDPKFWHELGVLLGSGGDHDSAFQAFTNALELNPQEHRSLLNLAVTYEALGDRAAAHNAIERVPIGTGRRTVVKANLLYSGEQYAEAIPLYEAAIEEEPEFDLPYLKLLDCLKQTDSPLQELWFTRAISAIPNSPELAAWWGRYLFLNDRLDELAEAAWIDTLQSHAGDLNIIGRRAEDPRYIIEAQLWKACGRLVAEPAAMAFEQAYRLLPAYRQVSKDCDPVLVVLASAVQLGMVDAVEPIFNLLCPHCNQHRTPGNSRLLTLKAGAHAARGQWQEAVALCERDLFEGQDHPNTLGLYWWALDEVGRTDEAVSAAKRQRVLQPDSEFLNFNLGYLCGKVGCHAEARYFYEKQREVLPGHLENLENLGVTLVLCGGIDEAERAFAQWQDCILQIHDASPAEGLDADALAFLRAKSAAATDLLQYATSLPISTYELDVRQFLESHASKLGSTVAVRVTPFTAEEMLRTLASADESRGRELIHRQLRTLQGDASAAAVRLMAEISGWRCLSDSAKSSLLEAERRIAEGGERDHAPEIVCFAKAVEITLKQTVFEPFKRRFAMAPDHQRLVEVALEDRFKQAHTFVRYVDRSNYIELGAMVHALRLCTGNTAKTLPILAQFRDYVGTELDRPGVFSAEFIEDADRLARARNPAAHEASFNSVAAKEAKARAVRLLSALLPREASSAVEHELEVAP